MHVLKSGQAFMAFMLMRLLKYIRYKGYGNMKMFRFIQTIAMLYKYQMTE